MKFSAYIIAASLFLGSVTSAYANAYDSISVYAIEKSHGSIATGSNTAYVKTYNITISNLSDTEADLSKICLKAYSAENKELRLDTVDANLVTGFLKKGQPATGTAIFASHDDIISKPVIVKLSDNCNFVRISR
ncbi:DUF4354 family protein [Acetobacter thailandicus]|uniref:DUF4354 family protein n=1 Tax=Acetobacter thailandicus TaxID=1502842 RepID=UPI001BA9D12F|nr:DUF4354 family protein [Acetobacter thailandicus]MBS0960274.1 DUF4354 family protein [Acetobacter thailandicus]MBS1003212.1 DUF4354 family protein [Acetobacter thailandicus]